MRLFEFSARPTVTSRRCCCCSATSKLWKGKSLQCFLVFEVRIFVFFSLKPWHHIFSAGMRWNRMTLILRNRKTSRNLLLKAVLTVKWITARRKTTFVAIVHCWVPCWSWSDPRSSLIDDGQGWMDARWNWIHTRSGWMGAGSGWLHTVSSWIIGTSWG